jgi:hypothetical protein
VKHWILIFAAILLGYSAKSQFAPPSGVPGTTAIHKDSSVFVAWATGCTVNRGWQDISTPSLGLTTIGDSSNAIGIADGVGIVSLGDGGSATLTFANPVTNGPGWDFAVFENSFLQTFLELAFVEVSSDGVNFFRFPSVSLTQDTVQVGTFGSVDATKISNLAGKYVALYGTPFDLDDMLNIPGLDVMHITHIRVVDVVGSVDDLYATYDSQGHKVNDPWPTPFPSSGFDLDAVGVIHQGVTAVSEHQNINQFMVYPNPVNSSGYLRYRLEKASNIGLKVLSVDGSVMLDEHLYQQAGIQSYPLNKLKLSKGIYLVQLSEGNSLCSLKFVVNE